MRFEWDGRKAVANAKKHGITFDEVATVFGDPLAVTFDDPNHSEDEDRFLTFGISANGKHIIVSHTPRGQNERIISARPMTPSERSIYEQS
ncbi:MAG: BrnT family toxin [Gammaproteobacteria bacterium]